MNPICAPAYEPAYERRQRKIIVWLQTANASRNAAKYNSQGRRLRDEGFVTARIEAANILIIVWLQTANASRNAAKYNSQGRRPWIARANILKP
jgi:hypothetical protein